jgi:hypothetical protein
MGPLTRPCRRMLTELKLNHYQYLGFVDNIEPVC